MTTEDELRRWNAAHNAADPREGVDDVTFLRRLQVPGSTTTHMVCLDRDGEIVAGGKCGARDGSSRGGIDVFVAPGSAVPFAAFAVPLIDAMESRTAALPAVERITAYCYEHDADRAEVWLGRGYRQKERTIVVGVDPREAVIPDVRRDLDIVTLAQRPDLDRQMHAVHNESWVATDWGSEDDVSTYERWRKQFDLWPGTTPQQVFMAIEGDKVTAVADVDYGGLPRAEEAWHGYTGVLPDHQGLGIGAALKAHTIEWARERGIELLLATNHENNAPMRHINARFGYEPQFAYLGFELTASQS